MDFIPSSTSLFTIFFAVDWFALAVSDDFALELGHGKVDM